MSLIGGGNVLWTKLIQTLHSASYGVRLALMIAFSVALNLSGILLTQYMGWSLLFLDMIGTASASFIGGLPAGLSTAFLTGVAGQAMMPRGDYLLFSISNMVGAFVWAMAPRTGRPLFGSYIFSTNRAAKYRRIFANMFVLGGLVAIFTSFSSFIVEFFILRTKKIIYSGSTSDVNSFGTTVSENNLILLRELINLFPITKGVEDYATFALSIFVTHLPDKIITTAVAIVVVLSWGSLPNFTKQKEILRNKLKFDGIVVRNNSNFIRFVYLLFLANYLIYCNRFHPNPTILIIASVVCVLPGIILLTRDDAYLSSVDRLRNVEHGILSDCLGSTGSDDAPFYTFPENYHYGRYKNAFEDVLKICTIFISGVSVIVAVAVGNGSSLYQFAIVNVLIITFLRYVAVIVMRIADRT